MKIGEKVTRIGLYIKESWSKLHCCKQGVLFSKLNIANKFRWLPLETHAVGWLQSEAKQASQYFNRLLWFCVKVCSIFSPFGRRLVAMINDIFDKQMHRKFNYVQLFFTDQIQLFLNNALNRKRSYIPRLTTFYKTERVGSILMYGTKSEIQTCLFE